MSNITECSTHVCFRLLFKLICACAGKDKTSHCESVNNIFLLSEQINYEKYLKIKNILMWDIFWNLSHFL